jgi:hypothetical protein
MSPINILKFFENKNLNKFNQYWIVIVAILYCLIIFNTIYWYFFPYPDLNTIFQDFRPYSFEIIEIVVLFIAIPLIPGFYRVKGAYKNLRLKRVPIPVVLMFAIPIPLFAFVNNCFTGNLIFSMILLTYGVIFTILAFKYR